MECGQCHDHKYDPISQEDYYRFYAFFNSSSDGGMQTRRGNAAPILQIADPVKEKQLPEKQQALTETKQAIERIENANVEQLTNWLTQQSDNPDQNRTYLDDCLIRFPLIEGEEVS